LPLAFYQRQPSLGLQMLFVPIFFFLPLGLSFNLSPRRDDGSTYIKAFGKREDEVHACHNWSMDLCISWPSIRLYVEDDLHGFQNELVFSLPLTVGSVHTSLFTPCVPLYPSHGQSKPRIQRYRFDSYYIAGSFSKARCHEFDLKGNK
jgi:hypothetical protein